MKVSKLIDNQINKLYIALSKIANIKFFLLMVIL